MRFLSLLAAQRATPWNTYFSDTEYSWLSNVFDYLYPTLWAVLAVVGAVGSIYAIWLGIQLAKAEDQSKRDEAKKRLIYTLIAVAVVVLLIVFFNELLPIILNSVLGAPKKGDADKTFISPILGFVRTFVR